MTRSPWRSIEAMLALALALGCSSAPRSAVEPTPDDATDTPFGRARGFTPTAFGVDVRGEGRAVILIPGIGCPGEVWDETVAHLGGQYQTHVLTLSGFAGRPAINEPLSAAVRRDLTRYIRSRKLRDPIVIGHSMGGFIAYWLAAAHPDLTGPVIVVDAGPALSGDVEEAKQLRSRFRQVSETEFADLTRAAFGSMTRDPKRMAPVIAKAAQSDQRAFADAVYELVTTDLTADVAAIKAPVLVLVADGALKERIAAQVESIPDHEVVVLRGTRHFLMFDDPEAYFAAIDAFLNRRSGARAPRGPTPPT
jgi:N-formylmaleamate deformylase